jgi:glycosyltransferase involved in cell wall biosynthesis
MNELNPLISVIVPVYNAEKRLVKCIDSILAQSYIHFELLLINDGSKDSSGTICDAYAQKDNRVKVFHKENGGASSARNIGIEHATGEYIVFVDSDDYVEKDYLSAFFVDPLNEDKFTFVVQSFKSLFDGIEIKQSVFKEGLYSEDNFSELFSINEINRRGLELLT